MLTKMMDIASEKVKNSFNKKEQTKTKGKTIKIE